MTDDHRALMQEALRELRRARARIAELEGGNAAPVVIAGMGCRLPGGIEDPDALWRFLARGGDAVGPVPADRWPAADVPEPLPPGAFLDDVFGFDAQLFRIAPREARYVDPQQRQLLEVAHATIEHAGLAPGSLRGSDTGVFTGISTNDWGMHLARHLPMQEIDGAAGPGTNACAAAGRVSFCLGLEGPSLATNTACSSSLVALHLAVQSLRRGECSLALVLGTNVMLTPLTTVTFQRGGMLSPDGRCKTFAATANGYGRGEGTVGMLLATRAAAQRLGLRTHAEVLGSAVNQDGATAGLTVPSGPAQQRVLKKALADAGVAARDVQYVEAHGTGTLLGDPIEVQALAAVYGAGRAATDPLAIASVKTNFGHLEAAAGLLGVMKAVLQLEHRTLAPHLHFTAPNPHLPWASLPVVVPTALAPWPPAERAIAGVSSFSFTGTNAHAIVAAPLDGAPVAAPSPLTAPLVLVLSARTPAALRAGCDRWAAHLRAHPQLSLADVCATAALGRSALRVRAALLADELPALVQRLEAASRGDAASGVWRGVAAPGDAPPHDVQPGSSAEAIASAFVAGAELPWTGLLPRTFRRLPLPAYAFQRRPFRATSSAAEPLPAPADLRGRLAQTPAAERAALLALHVQASCAAVLRLQPDEVSLDEPLADYGFDSMRAAELAAQLERDAGIPLPFVELMDGATAADVGAAIARRWNAAPPGGDAALLATIAAMPPAEVERRLREAQGGSTRDG